MVGREITIKIQDDDSISVMIDGREIKLQDKQNLREVLPAVDSSLNLLARFRQGLLGWNGLATLRSRKKLCLVLDLDQTLLHTKGVHKLSPQEHIGLCNSSLKDDLYGWNCKVSGVNYLTKLRPFVRKFLREASKLFEMCVYTNGTRDYARNMVGFLDPDSVYFGYRVISREDSTIKGQKGLDIVPVHKSGVVVLDDTENVWARDRSNLVLIKPYNYFSLAPEDPNRTRSLSEVGMDESESAGPLSRALGLLQQVHKSYFEGYDIFGKELLGILLHGNGILREKLQGIKDGNYLCDLGSRKRKRVNDGCPSANASKMQRC